MQEFDQAQLAHVNSHFKNVGRSSQHQYHSSLPLQQSCSVTGGRGVGLIYGLNLTGSAKT